DGHVRLSDVLALPEFSFPGHTVKEVEELVAGKDEKKRFQLRRSGGELWIRANQGHTMRCVQDDKLLQPISPGEEVPCCVHGTFLGAWESIVADGGLSRMTRNHVHFAPRPPGADLVISGMRSDCEVAVYVSVARAMAGGGVRFFRSANDVILTPGDERGMVSCEYFERAVRLLDGAVLWPRPADGSALPPIPALKPAQASDTRILPVPVAAGSADSSDDEEIVFGRAILGPAR
ncbi:unnamed protein product, partial [Polarella glacialis]